MNRTIYVTFFSLFAGIVLVLIITKPGEPPASSHVTIVPALFQTAAAKSPKRNKSVVYQPIEWTDLLPDEDLKALENPPDYLAEIEDGSEADQVTSQLKSDSADKQKDEENDRYQQALTSKNIRAEFDGRTVRIPGFIVPLEFDDQQTVTTFFLVPFFGACIHVPPPPPNQIIYAEYEPGMRLEALYDPFWINGTLSTTLVENEMATSAYTIAVSSIEPYYSEQDPLVQ